MWAVVAADRAQVSLQAQAVSVAERRELQAAELRLPVKLQLEAAGPAETAEREATAGPELSSFDSR